MDKSEFVRIARANPFTVFPFPYEQVPADWWAEVWQADWVRHAISSDMARTVGKAGHLSYVDGYCEMLARALTPRQLAALYVFIRDKSLRHESEWRPQFESLFKSCVSVLPAQRPEPPPEDGGEVTGEFTGDDIPF